MFVVLFSLIMESLDFVWVLLENFIWQVGCIRTQQVNFVYKLRKVNFTRLTILTFLQKPASLHMLLMSSCFILIHHSPEPFDVEDHLHVFLHKKFWVFKFLIAHPWIKSGHTPRKSRLQTRKRNIEGQEGVKNKIEVCISKINQTENKLSLAKRG